VSFYTPKVALRRGKKSSGSKNGCVTVLFLESNERKKFIYPNAFGRFLVLENEKLFKQLQDYDYENEIAHSIAAAQRESRVPTRSFEKIQKVKIPAPKNRLVSLSKIRLREKKRQLIMPTFNLKISPKGENMKIITRLP
jgi:hypothetical protein